MLFLLLLTVFTALSQLFLKLSKTTHKRGYLYLSVFLFSSLPVLSYLALKSLTIGVVYMSTAVSQLFTLILSRYVLSEKINEKQFANIALIVTGLIIYNLD